MNDDRKFTRRKVLSLWLKEEPQAADQPATGGGKSEGAFSLDAFYEARSPPNASNVIPKFQLREGLANVPTTSVGTPASTTSHIAVPPIPRGGPPGAATADRPHVVAGRLRVHRGRCLAWQRSFCTVCSEHCPELGAIRLEGGRPIVNDARCTRCGICVEVCPAPINAFEIVAVDGTPVRA